MKPKPPRDEFSAEYAPYTPLNYKNPKPERRAVDERGVVRRGPGGPAKTAPVKRPKRTGKSPLDQGLDFIFSPFTALSGIVNQNAPIKNGGKYQVPQDMMKGQTKRQNSVTAHPKARPGKTAGAAVGKMAKNRKPLKRVFDR